MSFPSLGTTHPQEPEVLNLLQLLERALFTPRSVDLGLAAIRVRNWTQALERILSVDESWLEVRNQKGESRRLYLVLGNDAQDLVANYTMARDRELDRVLEEYMEHWEN